MGEKACLRYFTGTGNSLRVLEICAEQLINAGYDVDLASITRKNPEDEAGDVFGFCFPVYALGLPRIAKRYLERLPTPLHPKRTFLYVTAGDPDDIGWALVEGKAILEAKGYRVSNSELVRMPVNWVPILPIPSVEEAEVILAEGEKRALEAIGRFLNGQDYHKPFNTKKLGPILSHILYHGFHKLGVRRVWRKFRTGPACTSCGLCARICPTGSIRMVGGKPSWSAGCEQCMRCVNFCPSKAILQLERIGKGSRNNRYHEPHFNPLKHREGAGE